MYFLSVSAINGQTSDLNSFHKAAVGENEDAQMKHFSGMEYVVSDNMAGMAVLSIKELLVLRNVVGRNSFWK